MAQNLIFVSYAHEDRRWCELLLSHLAALENEGLVSVWDDNAIRATAETGWESQLLGKLNDAGVIVVLLSPAFAASRYCQTVELPRAIERKKKGEAVVVFVLARKYSVEQAIREFQILPSMEQSIARSADPDEELAKVVEEIRAELARTRTRVEARRPVGTTFVAYAREDAAFAGRLAGDLRKAGLAVWLDEDLEAGRSWDEEIEAALKGCKDLVVVLSPDAVASREVKSEYSYVLGRGTSVIPVVYRECEVPYRLHLLQHIDFRSDYEGKLARLLKRLGVEGGEPVPARAVVPKVSDPGRVWIPAGTFTMGASEGDEQAWDDEKPAHRVTLTKGFWMSRTPVTVEEYRRYAEAKGKEMPDAPSFNADWKQGRHPMVNVSWEDAKGYCEWAGGRLPTEAEWEYAARGGTPGSRYGELDEIAWYKGNSRGSTHEVGLKKANAYGLYDMLGNVWEWVGDWWGEYENGAVTDPKGPATRSLRMLRGGSWNGASRLSRCSYRGYGGASIRLSGYGFRGVWE